MLKEVKGDITKIEADVIINAANTELIHGGGVALAIARAAGEDLVKESKEIGFVSIGDFAVTTAGKLKAKKVIHIPTIDYVNNKKITYKELEEVLEKVFKYCRENNFYKIATPLLGTGVVGLEKEKVKEIIKNLSEKFNNLEVIIVEK
ncbi:MAG: macro domain-containing protein [Minisyncoccia bacterium]|jgi:O-acetyl-ADP-ribose deacetylase (regulator of RNase III)